MKSTLKHPKHDIFYWLKRLTVAGIRTVLEWAHRHAMETRITYLDASESFRRLPGDKSFEEVITYVGTQAKPFFRVILRKDQNWYLLMDQLKKKFRLVESVCHPDFS